MEMDFKKYDYKELDYSSKSERSCYTVGRVYRYKSIIGDVKRGLLDGDLLLCIMKSGDCFYEFVRIQYNTTTNYSPNGLIKPPFKLWNYYNVLDRYTSNGGMQEAFPNMEALSELDLVHVLMSKQVLIPQLATKTDKQLEELAKLWEAEDKLRELEMKQIHNG